LVRSGHHAGASTSFLLEQGICDEPVLNNVKEIMDTIVEFKTENNRFLGRIQGAKGQAASRWTDVTRN
jgi:hypothetical protein